MNQFNIFIIDDDKDIHEILEIALEDFNQNLSKDSFSKLEIHNAFQGIEGLEKIQQQINQNKTVDLIVLDMMMPPGIDGLEVLKRLTSFHRQFKIIISSAYHFHDNQELLKVIKPFNEVYYLQKPYDLSDYLNLCRAMLLNSSKFLENNKYINLKNEL